MVISFYSCIWLIFYSFFLHVTSTCTNQRDLFSSTNLFRYSRSSRYAYWEIVNHFVFVDWIIHQTTVWILKFCCLWFLLTLSSYSLCVASSSIRWSKEIVKSLEVLVHDSVELVRNLGMTKKSNKIDICGPRPERGNRIRYEADRGSKGPVQPH